MNPTLQNDILNRLSEFNFKHQQSGYLRGGTCPQCQKKELYIKASHPWILRCGRLNHCGYEGHVKQIYPDLFDDWSKRYAELVPQNPNAVADAYLQHGRGFDLSKIHGTYTQESYFDPESKIGSATVRFSIGNGYWERLIDKPERFGKKKARFSYELNYQGLWWMSPNTIVQLPNLTELWLVEGIFDAIALEHHGIAAAALMSCHNYPNRALQQLRETSNNKCQLVWALDSDTAGQRFLTKHIERAREEGWKCVAAQIPQCDKAKLDWNDLHQRERLSETDITNYRYHGALLIAKNASEKALLIYKQENKLEFDFEFKNRLYWFDLSLTEYTKQLEQLDKENDGTLTEESKREKALSSSHSLRQIANCKPTALYYQKNDLTDEAWYYFRVDFPHDGAPVKNTFTSSQVASATEFKKRLLGIAAGAMYSGTSAMLDKMMERDLFHIKRVETIDYIGYSKEHGCYIFDGLAVRDGVLYEINGEDFYDLGRTSIKSLNKSVSLTVNKDTDGYSTDWFTHLWNAFGAKGGVALTFWFGTLFSEQIRATQSSFPFLEIVGKAGAGKSTLIEFLWKLFGRIGYEGFDPSKSSLAARARNFSQVSGLPVVLIESDRERMDGEKSHFKSFDWDELKTAYNGRSTRARGMNTGGNETYEPPFRGAIVISQNNPVIASDAILSRIVHLYFDLSTQTIESGHAADILKFMPAENVSGFILAATKLEKKIMEVVTERRAVYVKELQLRPELKMPRIIETHAQLLALVDALALVIPLCPEQQNAMRELIVQMAGERQKVINDDHPLVQEFWEVFDYLDANDQHRLNHSRDPQLIAVNLNHFIQVATERRQQIPVISELKKVLRTSRKRKFIDVRVVNSQIKAQDNHPLNSSTSIKCWVFQNEKATAC